MKRILIAAIAAGLAMLSLQAMATPQGDPVAGKAKSEACAACHGADGNSDNPQFPRLAGQYADYMVRALMDYRSGRRQNAIMAGIVAGLSEQDMQDVAAYYASLPGNLHVKATVGRETGE